MRIVPLPAWNSNGLLPSVDITNTASKLNRSPHNVYLREFVERYATSIVRNRMLEGFFRYRAELHKAGILSGFQWIDGSFVDDIERIGNRDPRDIDVVTFYNLQPGDSEGSAYARNPIAFPINSAERERIKTDFHVDSIFVPLEQKPELLVEETAYWTAMWSHQRDTLAWKGYIQVNLALSEDIAAEAFVKSLDLGVNQQ